MSTAQQKVQTLLEQAEKTRLFGEIHLRFKDGRLTFITEEKTTPMDLDGPSRDDRIRTLRY